MKLPTSILTKHQTKVYGPKLYTEHGTTYKLTVTVRYDDQCNNGYNSFSITAMQYRVSATGRLTEDSGGCMHDTIAKQFPELAPYIKWHLTSSDGPLHYIANTFHLAGDCDGWGLQKGERRQLTNGRTDIGKGKARELDKARRAAIWPDATDEELIAPGLEERLAARLPGLMQEFKQAVEELGFTY